MRFMPVGPVFFCIVPEVRSSMECMEQHVNEDAFWDSKIAQLTSLLGHPASYERDQYHLVELRILPVTSHAACLQHIMLRRSFGGHCAFLARLDRGSV